ncbi:NF-kappa-B-activating protein [Chloropicon roscoffensis]|uniref:NF-kappa-B-activating protein n=2 Tax=Chloropicon roscoffensis TaxID=1461544 RepID=A0AAX4NXP1_9CHLO
MGDRDGRGRRERSPPRDSWRRERRRSPSYDREDRGYRRGGARRDGVGGRERGRNGWDEERRDHRGYGGGRPSASGNGHGHGGQWALDPHPLGREADDALRAKSKGDEREYRRLKRLELAGKVRVSLWGRSPSPPPEEGGEPPSSAAREMEEQARAAEEEREREREESLERQRQEKERERAARAESVSDEEDAKAELDRFNAFLAKLEREREARLAEQARLEEESKLVGPERPAEHKPAVAPGTYGKNLLPGEGDAMAAYVQSGKRIPRRGEIGLTSGQISSYEDLGFVMSGNRHSRMNAIRIRKENQVYSAEEKAALAMINFEEKKVKEQQVMQSMQALVKQHLQREEGGGE